MRPPTRTTRSARPQAPNSTLSLAGQEPLKLKPRAIRPNPADSPATLPRAPKPITNSGAAVSISENNLDDDSEPVCSTSSKKPRSSRHRMTEEKLARLDAVFERNTHPSRMEKEALCVELDMSLKSITIWFQNRRQTAKKLRESSSTSLPVPPEVNGGMDILASASVLVPRPRLAQPFQFRPLDSQLGSVQHNMFTFSSLSGCVPHLAPATPLHKHIFPLPRKPLAMVSPNSNVPAQDDGLAATFPNPIPSYRHEAHTLILATRLAPSCAPSNPSSIPPHDLWKYIPSSPVESYPLPFPDVSSESSSSATLCGKRPRSLEWACDRLAKRRRENPKSIDSEEEEEPTPELGRRSPSPTPQGRKRFSYQTSAVRVPLEYHTLFPPDIVQGAVLLLALKGSAVLKS